MHMATSFDLTYIWRHRTLLRPALAKPLFRGRLQMPDFVYDSSYDFTKDLHTKVFGFQFSIIHQFQPFVNPFEEKVDIKFNSNPLLATNRTQNRTNSVLGLNLPLWGSSSFLPTLPGLQASSQWADREVRPQSKNSLKNSCYLRHLIHLRDKKTESIKNTDIWDIWDIWVLKGGQLRIQTSETSETSED
jgi:hypothetical protein